MLRRRKNVGHVREEPTPHSTRGTYTEDTKQTLDSSTTSEEDSTRSYFPAEIKDHARELLDEYEEPEQHFKRGSFTFSGARRRKEMRRRAIDTSSDSGMSSGDELVFTEGEEENEKNYTRHMARGRKSRLVNGRGEYVFDLAQNWERDIEMPHKRQNRMYVLLGAVLLMIGFRVLRVAVTAWGRAQKHAANKEKL